MLFHCRSLTWTVSSFLHGVSQVRCHHNEKCNGPQKSVAHSLGTLEVRGQGTKLLSVEEEVLLIGGTF